MKLKEKIETKGKKEKKEIKENKSNLSKKEILNIISKELLNFLKNNIIFVIGVILLIYKGILLNLISGVGIGKNMIFYLIAVSLFLMCPIINNKKKFSYIYLNVAYAVITLFIYLNYLYYSYSTNFLSFYQIQNLQYAKEIGEGLLVLINSLNLFAFWIDNVILLILSIYSYKKVEKTKYKNIYLKTFLIVLIIILNSSIIKKDINGIFESKGYNKSLIVQGTSIYYYHYEDAKDYFSSFFIKEKIDEERLKKAYQDNIDEKTKETKYTGIAKDKNVIIVQLESMNEYIIGKKVNGKEITPNLNKFFGENIYCKDMYNQGLGSTADSEFEMENSMYPLENGYVFQKYYNNKWLDIFTTLKNEGYYTSFMHPNTSTFWNREEVYNVGYHIDEYNDINKFPNIEQAGEFYSDEGFLVEAVNIMNNYDKKFCSALVTVTTHIPFYLDGVSDLENKVTITEDDVANYTDDVFKNYIISCNFADYAFGRFIEELEKTDLMENSIIIVYGDHGSGSSNDDLAMLFEENNEKYTDLELVVNDTHIPFGIKIPGVNDNSVIERTVSKIDIKPTLLDILGIENTFSIGDNIFSDKDYAFIKGLGFITSKIYNINEINYNRKTFEEMERTEESDRLIKKMEDEIYLSDTIIKNNLLKK